MWSGWSVGIHNSYVADTCSVECGVDGVWAYVVWNVEWMECGRE